MPPDPPSFSCRALDTHHYRCRANITHNPSYTPPGKKTRRRHYDLAFNPLFFADYICPFSQKLARQNSIQKKDDKVGQKKKRTGKTRPFRQIIKCLGIVNL